MAEEEPLADLVARSRRGERDAIDALVRRMEEPLREAIRRRLDGELHRRVDTEDIFQTTILVALEELARFEYRGEREFEAWLTSVAERRIVDAARHHRAQKRDIGRDRPLADAGETPATHTSPTQGAVRGETKIRIEAAVARLPDDLRQVVTLRSWQGLPFREIAARMGLPDKVAAFRLYQAALERLGEMVEEG